MKEMEITPEELLADLTYAQNLRDGRILILFLHLYLEHFINELSKELSINEDSILSKAEVLLKQKTIKIRHFEVIKLINKLRNIVVHRLTVNAEDVENIFDNLKMEVVCDNPHLLNVWKQSIVETKIQVITIPAIVELYGVLKELKKEESQYKIQLRLLANYSWGFDFIKKN